MQNSCSTSPTNTATGVIVFMCIHAFKFNLSQYFFLFFLRTIIVELFIKQFLHKMWKKIVFNFLHVPFIFLFSCLSYQKSFPILTTLFPFLLIFLCYPILYCPQLPLFPYVAIAVPITKAISISVCVFSEHPFSLIQHLRGPSPSFLLLVFLPNTLKI